MFVTLVARRATSRNSGNFNKSNMTAVDSGIPFYSSSESCATHLYQTILPGELIYVMNLVIRCQRQR